MQEFTSLCNTFHSIFCFNFIYINAATSEVRGIVTLRKFEVVNCYVRPVGQSPTATNAHDPVTSERGGPSPYRAVEPWLLLLLLLLL
jgi:hypothetical protein